MMKQSIEITILMSRGNYYAHCPYCDRRARLYWGAQNERYLLQCECGMQISARPNGWGEIVRSPVKSDYCSLAEWERDGFRVVGRGEYWERDAKGRWKYCADSKPVEAEVGFKYALVDYYRQLLWLTSVRVTGNKINMPSVNTMVENIIEPESVVK